jgi:hypothetical protein
MRGTYSKIHTQYRMIRLDFIVIIFTKPADDTPPCVPGLVAGFDRPRVSKENLRWGLQV